jgi:hypothetical protein
MVTSPSSFLYASWTGMSADWGFQKQFSQMAFSNLFAPPSSLAELQPEQSLNYLNHKMGRGNARGRRAEW